MKDLQAAIVEYVEEHNEPAKGRRWTALPEAILAKLKRVRAVIDNTPST